MKEVQQSASQILWSQEGTAFLQPEQQKANPGATCSLLKGALRWAKQVSSHQHTARHEPRAKTCNTENANRMQGKMFANKNVQARGWNHPLQKCSKLKWSWPTCSKGEACSAYSRGQGQVTPSGPYRPKFLTNMLHNPQYHVTHAGSTTCSVIKTRFERKQSNYSHMLHMLSVF